ncbi:MAG: lmo0937 family membrane protein [Acidobacteria bacterium]|nr:lmo0937 family membrane protein [Acidobacteriota bacterium]
MLLTIAVVLLLLWVLGMITATTFYGFLHIILILALALFLIRIIESV